MTAKFWEKFKHKTFCDDRIVMIKNCLYCKKEFIPLRKKKGETTKFCCYQCSSLYAKENMLKKNCIECNKLFKAPNNRCKFCGILCWNKNNLQKRREYVSNYIKNNPIKYKKSYDKRNKKIGKNIERYDKNCLICNKVFEDKTLNFNKKFCSKKCRGVSCDKRYKEKGGVGLKLHINISSRIRGTFKKNKPLNKYLEIFGYNIDDIKKHLQNKFRGNDLGKLWLMAY